MADNGLGGLLKQLQTDDPSSPANALSQLVRWWSDWRAGQAETPDIENPPVSLSAPGGLASLMGILRDAAGKPMRMFHGTKKVFDEFDMAKADPNALYGPGGYFTNNPTVASNYPAPSQAVLDTHMIKPIQRWRDNVERYTKEAENASGADRAELLKVAAREQAAIDEALSYTPNVRPAFLDIKRPFDIDAPAAEDVTRGLLGWRSADAPNAKNNEVYDALVAQLGKVKTTELLRDLGYDSITHTGGKIMGAPPHKVGIVFDPKQVLSPWKVPD